MTLFLPDDPGQDDLATFLSRWEHGPWTVRACKTGATDQQVLRLRQVVPGRGWSEVPTFLDFLSVSAHRTLLHCFLPDAQRPQWRFDELLMVVGPDLSPMTLSTALLFCEQQGFVIRSPHPLWWYPGPQLRGVHNFGATFEWMVQQTLRREYSARAWRGVLLSDLPATQFGDLDVLAVTADGHVITIECKSSSSGLLESQLERFLGRAEAFQSDLAVLLVDTDQAAPLLSHLERLQHLLRKREARRGSRGRTIQALNGQVTAWLGGNLYLANTAGGISHALRAVLELFPSASRPDWSVQSGDHSQSGGW